MGEFLTTERIKEIIGQAPPGMEKRDIIQGLVAKGHEIEGLNREFSPLNTVKNVIPSTIEFGKNIFEAIKNPIQTGKALGDVAEGALQTGLKKLIPGTEFTRPDKTQAFDIMVDFYRERFGTAERTLETIERDPAGFLADISTIVGVPAGAAARVVPAAGKIAKIARAVEPTVLAGKATSKVVKSVRNFNKITGIEKIIIAKAGEFGEKALEITPAAATKIAQRTFRKPPGQILAEFGIRGNLEDISTQLKNLAKSSKQSVDSRIASIEGTFRNARIRKSLKNLQLKLRTVKSPELLKTRRRINELLRKHDGKIDVVEAKKLGIEAIETKVPGRRIAFEERPVEIRNLEDKFKAIAQGKTRLTAFVDNATPEQLQRLNNVFDKVEKRVKEPIRALDEAIKKMRAETKKLKGELPEPKGLTLEEINEIKRIFDAVDNPFSQTTNIKGIGVVDFGKTAIKAQDVKNLRNSLQTFIEKTAEFQGVTDLRQLNKQTIFGTQLGQLVDNARFSLKNRKSFMDSLILQAGLAGSIFTANMEFILGAAGVTLGRRIIQSPRFRSAVSNKLMSLTENQFKAIEFAVKNKQITPNARKVLRESFKSLQPLFPELRVAGITKRETQ